MCRANANQVTPFSPEDQSKLLMLLQAANPYGRMQLVMSLLCWPLRSSARAMACWKRAAPRTDQPACRVL